MSSAAVAKSKRPDNSHFKQQTLKAWRPVLSPRLVILLFSGVGTIFVPIGIAIVVASNQVIEVESSDYDGSCCVSNCSSLASWSRVDQNPCSIEFEVPEEMKPPIYMYYKLTNFYQNHRRYVRSRDDQQLKGNDAGQNTLSGLQDACEYHYVKNGSLINPCGLIAWSYFNDSFTLLDPIGLPVSLATDEIAWQTDIDQKFGNSVDGTTGQNFPPFAYERSRSCAELPTVTQQMACTDANVPDAGWCYPGSGYCTESQHFIIWMRTAALPSFRKLYAKIDRTLPAGRYTLRVSNGVLDGSGIDYVNYGHPIDGAPSPQRFLYPVSTFGGTKSVVLSTAAWIGGKNFFLGYAYVSVGGVCVVLAICFFLKVHYTPRALGNAPYISWNKDATPK